MLSQSRYKWYATLLVGVFVLMSRPGWSQSPDPPLTRFPEAGFAIAMPGAVEQIERSEMIQGPIEGFTEYRSSAGEGGVYRVFAVKIEESLRQNYTGDQLIDILASAPLPGCVRDPEQRVQRSDGEVRQIFWRCSDGALFRWEFHAGPVFIYQVTVAGAGFTQPPGSERFLSSFRAQ